MRKLLGIFWDYVLNAIVSAAIGGLVFVGISLFQSEGLSRPGFAVSCALVGVTGGTASKLIIEGVFALFGARRWIAYALDMVVVAGIVVAYVLIFFGSFEGLNVWAVLTIFVVPEAASLFIVRFNLERTLRIQRAFDKLREELEKEVL